MRHPIRRGLAATAVTTLAIGLGLSACGADDQPRSSGGTPSASASGTAAPATAGPTPAAPGATGQPGGTGSGAGSGSGSGGDSGYASGGDGPGQPPEPTGPPPRILRTTVEPYLREGDLVADVLGHAYDDHGPDPQLRVARVEIGWGDGSTTAAQLGGDNVFRDSHEYDPSYQGRTVTVRIVAYGHDGQTTTETRTVPLPG